MPKLSVVFRQLSSGELRNISYGRKSGDGGPVKGISEAVYPEVVDSINLALTALHSRFLLKVGTITIDLQPGQTHYPLRKEYQVGGCGKAALVKFIRNDGEKFCDDIIKVETVADDDGKELLLNRPNNKCSALTPSFNMLVVPLDLQASLKVKTVTVVYRKNHKEIVVPETYFAPECVEVDLPSTHLQALLYYVASRANNPVGFSDQTHEGNNYMSKYLSECVMLENQGLKVETVETYDCIERGGWV